MNLFAMDEPVIHTEQSFKMRPYQEEAVQSIYRVWEDKTISTLVVSATGTGKTVIMSEVCKRWPHDAGKILVIAHRRELIQQAADKIGRHLGEPIQIEMAEQRARLHGRSRVVVSSVQTQTAGRKCKECGGKGGDCWGCIKGKVRRMQRFRPDDFGMLLIDEGHHATASTYRMILDYYGQNPNLKVLLVTATPKRADNIGLHNVADEVAFEMGIARAIDEGWLVPVKQRYVTVKGLDFSQCKTKRGGDLADGDVQRAMMGGHVVADRTELTEAEIIEQEEMLHAIVTPTIEEAAGRSFLIFASGQEHAKRLTEICNRHDGVEAHCIIDSTPQDVRAESIRRFKSGEIQGLVGCMVLTEGFDAPIASVIAQARPTKSEALYTQIVGRGTRPLEGVVDGPGLETAEARKASIAASDKPCCVILDFVGNSGRHKLISTADILGGDAIDEDVEAALKGAAIRGEAVDIREEIERAKEDREERERKAREDAERKRQEYERRQREEAEQARQRQHIVGRAEWHAEEVDPFDASRHIPEQEIPRGGATDKQVAYLTKLGVSRTRALGMSKRQASAVIDKLTAASGPDYVMRFGKHRGKRLRDIPRGYLQWLMNTIDGGKQSDVLTHVRATLTAQKTTAH